MKLQSSESLLYMLGHGISAHNVLASSIRRVSGIHDVYATQVCRPPNIIASQKPNLMDLESALRTRPLSFYTTSQAEA